MSMFHFYHLVELSPWPFSGAVGGLLLTSGMVKVFYGGSYELVLFGVLMVLLTMFQWWRDVIRESMGQGHHTEIVVSGLKVGMVLFILSEVLFFVSFFWAFFHSSLAPNIELGILWPPTGVAPFNVFGVPLLNTSILLSSGITVTWCHYSILNGDYKQGVLSLFFTVLLGLYFTLLQGLEYHEASFCVSDSVYGTTFFVATGFHGLHVIIGSSFLIVCLYRIVNFHFSLYHHFGFEAAAWYWHFVDVVWLFLFISIYWWGSY
uniref:Cytochrome c oxidase subunit 3 n=1 Tax=Heterometrus longimanus TaxID=1719223 RepID=A0A0U2MBD4_9SCOR|nr:cytochrome c oxidase subunit III [Heterometrus longimanus]